MSILNACLRKVFRLEVRRFKEEEVVAFSKNGKKWDYAQYDNGWIGGRFDAEAMLPASGHVPQ